MSDDIRTILERLTVLEGTVTSPAYPKKGLNKQQKSVPELPALFKPKNISPVLGSKKDPKHPTAGYFVGDESKKHTGEIIEGIATEDMIGAVRRGLNDYLRSLERDMEIDHALVNKAKDEIQRPDLDKLLAVKTLRTHDGRELKIHGNESDGFVVKINERPLSAQFKNIDEAELACEMYCARRHATETQEQLQDYVDEE